MNKSANQAQENSAPGGSSLGPEAAGGAGGSAASSG